MRRFNNVSPKHPENMWDDNISMIDVVQTTICIHLQQRVSASGRTYNVLIASIEHISMNDLFLCGLSQSLDIQSWVIVNYTFKSTCWLDCWCNSNAALAKIQ